MSDTLNQVLIAKGLAKTYGQGATAVQVLKSVDLEINRSEKVAIVGSAQGISKPNSPSMMGCAKMFARSLAKASNSIKTESLKALPITDPDNLVDGIAKAHMPFIKLENRTKQSE